MNIHEGKGLIVNTQSVSKYSLILATAQFSKYLNERLLQLGIK